VDGLVFVVNESNPVENLTTEQIQKIYSGEITNWSEVGGDDVDIVPFQRNEEAGSQTAMKKLVMGGIPMMEAPAEYVSGAMGDLVKVVASYNDSAAAIGYTVYYYAHDMKMADRLKLLAVDGIQPSAETIRSRAYPFINDSYVVIRAGLPDDAPAKILYDWLLSAEGQRLVAQEGYVSVLDVGGQS
jgi:phosphate transport system substrate-binding protein